MVHTYKTKKYKKNKEDSLATIKKKLLQKKTIVKTYRSSNKKIPRKIYQTFYDKTLVPKKVYKNIKKYAPKYKHTIYGDQDCINFMNKYYNANVLKAFSFDSAEAVVDDDNYVCEIRTNIYSSAPKFTSANSYFRSKNLTSYLNIAGSIVNSGAYFGLLALNVVPFDTTFNYSS